MKDIEQIKKVTADLEKIMKIPESEIVYLDYSNCYIHCHKNAKCFHKCLNRLILYEGFIYCVHCKKFIMKTKLNYIVMNVMKSISLN